MMDVKEALATVDIWHEAELDCCKDSPACALAAEVKRLEAIEQAARQFVGTPWDPRPDAATFSQVAKAVRPLRDALNEAS